MTVANASWMEPEVRTMLGRHREELLRRALALAVRRASLEELSARPLGARLDELELLFEAAAADGGASTLREPGHVDLQTELHQQLDAHRHSGRVFSVAVIAAGTMRVARLGEGAAERRAPGPDTRAWTNALRECAAPTDVVVDAGDGATAVVLPDHDAREARVAVDRLCQAAWRLLGGEGPLAVAGVASFPDDGSSATEILAGAYDALWRRGDTGAEEMAELDDPAADDGPPAPVHPLRPL